MIILWALFTCDPENRPLAPSHQRRDDLHKGFHHLVKEFLVPDAFLCHFPAFCKCGLIIRLHIVDTGRLIKIRSALKMMVQAAVIQIDGSDNAFSVITDEHLRVNKARGIFIQLYAGIQQSSVMGLGQRIGKAVFLPLIITPYMSSACTPGDGLPPYDHSV